jgi:hypothetical protein
MRHVFAGLHDQYADLPEVSAYLNAANDNMVANLGQFQPGTHETNPERLIMWDGEAAMAIFDLIPFTAMPTAASLTWLRLWYASPGTSRRSSRSCKVRRPWLLPYRQEIIRSSTPA